MIEIVSYRRMWGEEFMTIGGALRQSLSESALRIDHIGSTAIPGLAAKDVIDVQVTVLDLDPAIERLLKGIGYQKAAHLADHIPPTGSGDPRDWSKWVFTEPPGIRRINLHVRRRDRANQRYALLFRDYLREHPAAAQAYGRVKQALGRLHPDDKNAYYEVKDPVCDIVMEAAEAWAAKSSWIPGPSDC